MLNKKTVLAIISVVVIIIGVIVGVLLVRQRQEVRKKAAVPGGQATISLTPSSGSYPVGGSIPINVQFNTDNIAISGIAVRIVYQYGSSSPELTVSDISISQSLLASDFTCPIKQINDIGGSVNIDISCINLSTTGYTSSTSTILATFNVNVDSMPLINPTGFSFDPNQSIITQKDNGQDILLIPTSTGSYTITGGSAQQDDDGDGVSNDDDICPNTPSGSSVDSNGCADSQKDTDGDGVTDDDDLCPNTPIGDTVDSSGCTISGSGGTSPTATPTPTPTSAASATATPISTLPDTGVSLPTILGIATGGLLLLGAFLIAL